MVAIKDETNIEKALRLKIELDNTQSIAIQELLEQRRNIEQQLGLLGHSEAVATRPVMRRSKPSADKVCPICNEPGHDGRRHKGEKKKPKK